MKDAAGVHRQLQTVASPESWVEDFGEGTLEKGAAIVLLNADFAALINPEAYYVYLTPRNDSRGLYVESKLPDRFVLREQQGGTGSLAFDYRVVARRKDVAVQRLAEVRLLNGTAAPASLMPA